jgi:NAD(P)-dependent dehydrogenase (short-subunit alcohol dehydrogenase family)
MNPQSTSVDGPAVLITGCSSGIGRAIALDLAAHGFTVFAGVRKQADAAKLRRLKLPGMVPVCPLDLTKRAQILAARRSVTRELKRRGKPGLYALINNAGGGSPAPVELMNLDEFQGELQARVLGSVAVLQAFLPLLRQASGRVVWIMTPALMPTPYVAGIHACDFAWNCIARTLEIELKPWGIPNIMIKCGGIRTPAGMRTTSDVEALLRRASPEGRRLYESALRKWQADMAAFDKNRTDPLRVADLVLRALTAGKPRRRYSIGYMAGAAGLLESLPQPMADAILKARF